MALMRASSHEGVLVQWSAQGKARFNSRMKLTVSLAAQSALRPLCLRRLPAAYASVKRIGEQQSNRFAGAEAERARL